MVLNTRDRNIDSSKREDSRIGYVDRCEVTYVWPHVRPYPQDKNFNVVDVMVINRPPSESENKIIKFVKLNCLQQMHGKFQGCPWNPRIGDMIFIYWLAKREALVLGSCASIEQEPVCRSQADDQQQEFVFKLCPWEEPKKNRAIDGNYVEFPNPKHPVCVKWWPKTRDSIVIFDCKNGHDRAQCDQCAPCNWLDDLIARTWFKSFTDISNTEYDLPWRFKFHHNSGSVAIFDQDGTIHIENKTSCKTCGGTGCTGTCSACNGTGLIDDELCQTCGGSGQNTCETCGGDSGEGKAHNHYYPVGTIDIHAGNPHPNKGFPSIAEETSGVRTACVHPDDGSVDFAWEAKDFNTGAYIQIKKSGEIVLHSPVKITLDAPLVEETHNNKVDGDNTIVGSCTHGPCSCA